MAKNRHDRFCRRTGDVDNGLARTAAERRRPSPLLCFLQDSVTNVEMAFAGSRPYGIFSGAFDLSSNSIAWGATAEAGSTVDTAGDDRVMSFAACGGKFMPPCTTPSWCALTGQVPVGRYTISTRAPLFLPKAVDFEA